MPGGISGVDLARELRQPSTEPTYRAHNGLCRSGRELAGGHSPLLPKPYSLEALAAALGVPPR